MTLRFTILGCGSSGGVPRIGGSPDLGNGGGDWGGGDWGGGDWGGGDWGACDPAEPKNRRRRCSALVQRDGPKGTTRVLIDTAPDMREQLLDARVAEIDAVVYTHAHADHLHGLDDLRQIVFNRRAKLPVWADAPTQDALLSRFAYAFVQPAGSDYPPICNLHTLDGPVTVDGAGGPITLTPFRVQHGNITALGFRIGDLVYLPDVSQIPDDAWPLLQGLGTWVLDALRHRPHPTHAHLALALEWIARARPRHAVLTNMHVDMDYGSLSRDLPPGVQPAHDGMVLRIAG